MKFTHIIFCLLLFFSASDINAQNYINQGNYWPYYAPNGAPRPSADDTGEDWWYDVKTVPTTHPTYAPGKYIGCGYSSFDDAPFAGPTTDISLCHLYTNDPCSEWTWITCTPPGPGFDPTEFELPDMLHMNFAGTIGLVNLTTTSSPVNPYQWIYHYGMSTQFTKVIPTTDGGFLATGSTKAFNVPYPTTEIQFQYFLANNPGSSGNPSSIYYQAPSTPFGSIFQKTAFTFSTCPPSFPSYPEITGKRNHACLAKVDAKGRLQWFYTYGLVPFGTKGDLAYGNNSRGIDLVEVSGGYILAGIAQNSPFYGDYANHGLLLKVDLSGNLLWIRQYANGAPYISEKFTGIKIKSATEAYLIGERTTQTGALFCTYPTSSACINVSNNAELEHHSSLRFQGFLEKIDITTTGGSVIWDYPITTNTAIGSRVRSLDVDINGKILVGVADECFSNSARAECLNTYIGKYEELPGGTGAQLVRNIPFGSMRAFDMSTGIGVKATTNGGFVVLGNKKAYNLDINKNYAGSPWGNGYNMTGFGNQVFAQSDAFIAKCNAAGNIEWTGIFDSQTDGGGGNIHTTAGNPRDQTNLDSWMNFTTTRSKADIKREECVYAITTSVDGEIIVAGNMSANIDDNYIAMAGNTCELNLNDHLIQAITTWAITSPTSTTQMNNFIASTINTGRNPGNTNQVAFFDVNSSAEVNIIAGNEINMNEGTDLEYTSSVDAYIDPNHTCTSGPVYSFAGNSQDHSNAISTNGEINKPSSNISIAPNPGKDVFTITHPASIKQLDILDMYGKLIFSKANHGSSYTRIDLGNQPSAMYLVRIDGVVGSLKIIKQ